MSTDFNACCDSCKKTIHVGQVMATIPSFGYGSTSPGSQIAAAAWVFEHARHGAGVRVELADAGDISRLSDEYTHEELEDWVKEDVGWSRPMSQACERCRQPLLQDASGRAIALKGTDERRVCSRDGCLVVEAINPRIANGSVELLGVEEFPTIAPPAPPHRFDFDRGIRPIYLKPLPPGKDGE